MTEQIKDINKYNNDMAKSMKDKVFFLDKINVKDVDNIVDFGCANGELFKYVPNSWSCIGIDNSDDMIKEAKQNFNEAAYKHSLDEVRHYVKDNTTNYLLNMSSVIHEVYSYLDDVDIINFWDNVWNSGYKYITIRDMMISNACDKEVVINKEILNGPNFDDFANKWCKDVVSQRDIIHYLLKYKYQDNWDRESIENYLPITEEELLNMIPSTYEIVYLEHYILPYLKDTVQNDFNYEIKDNTHIKLILRRKD